MKSKRTMKRLFEWLDEWIENPNQKPRCIGETSDAMQKYLDGGDMISFSKISLYGHWHGSFGMSQLLAGKEKGWENMQIALRALALADRILFAMLDTKKARGVGGADPFFILLHAMATRWDVLADWFGKRMIHTIQISRKLLEGWDYPPVHPFALCLYAKWRGLSTDFNTGNMLELAVYKDVLSAWDTDQAFAKTMQKACEYHLYQAFDDSDNDTQDFCHKFYDLFPVEIHAIARVRRDQGLPMPQIDHPLMQTGLGTLPEVMPRGEDELLEKVAAKVCLDFGLTDLWK